MQEVKKNPPSAGKRRNEFAGTNVLNGKKHVLKVENSGGNLNTRHIFNLPVKGDKY